MNIGVIGIRIIGLVSGTCCADSGNKVFYADIDGNKGKRFTTENYRFIKRVCKALS